MARKSKVLTVLIYMLLVGMTVWFVAGWFVPDLLTELYESSYGGKLRLTRYPIEKWLKQWDSIWARGFIVGTTLTIFLAAINSSRFRAWFDRMSPLTTTATAGSKTRWSRVPFYVLGSVILFGQFVDVMISREHWPFSHFPMYTGMQKLDYMRVRVDGVLADGSEISLTPYFVPLSPGKVGAVVLNSGRRDPREHANRCAEEYFMWYQQSKKEGRHDGPPIVATRIYQLDWVLQEDAGNLDAPEKTLIAQYTPSGKVVQQ